MRSHKLRNKTKDKYINFSQGITLTELMVVISILLIIIIVFVPLIKLIREMTSAQFKDSGSRMALREASTSLGNDIRYSKGVIINEDDPSEIRITDGDGNEIIYSIKTDSRGKDRLVREKAKNPAPLTLTFSFDGIKDARFVEEIENLVFVELLADEGEGKYYDYKFARLGFSIGKKNGGETTPEEEFYEDLVAETYFIYGGNPGSSGSIGIPIRVLGSSSINSPDGTIVLFGDLIKGEDNDRNDLGGKGVLNVKNIYINGRIYIMEGSVGLGLNNNTGSMYIDGDMTIGSAKTHNIYGNVYINGDFTIYGATIHGNLYVNGDVTMGDSGEDIVVNGKIYYKGDFDPGLQGSRVTDNCIKDDTIIFDKSKMPKYRRLLLRPDDWYYDKNYDISTSSNVIPLASGKRIFSLSDYTTNHWESKNNIIVVCKGDITIQGNQSINGIFIAPEGRITQDGTGDLEGIFIARDGFHVNRGNVTVISKNIKDFFSNPEELPFTVEGVEGD